MWNKIKQPQNNKWIITAGIAVILLIALFSGGKNSDTKKQTNEIATLKAQLDLLQKQIESEKQQNIESSQPSITSKEENPKEKST